MPKPNDSLDRININSPCTADWDEMVGNDQVRFCRHCDLSVHNLSAMTRQEALRLVISSKGKLCARYIRRPDGAIHTTDLVLHQLHSIKRRASRIAAGAFSAALGVSSSVVAAAPASPGSTPTNMASSSMFARNGWTTIQGSVGAGLTGVVEDPNGAVIAGATVTLRNEEGGLEQTTITDDEGVYSYQNLDAGKFTLRIECQGFAVQEIGNITISANKEHRVNAALNVTGTELVTVGGAMFVAPSDPLVAAAVGGDVVEVKALLASGADVDVIDQEYDSTALAQAVINGNRELVDILLNAGAEINLKSKSGRTALMSLSGATTPDIVWTLIDAGAKVDLRADDGKNALLNTVGYITAETLRALLDAGAPVDARDEDDRTALMIAATVGSAENVEVLLKAGATVNLRDEDGTTALGLALENDFEETARVLRAFGGTE